VAGFCECGNEPLALIKEGNLLTGCGAILTCHEGICSIEIKSKKSLEACCCSSNLRFNLYCLSYAAFFYFLTASMSVSAILVTRCAFKTIL
jgi:hypothetical protein